MTRLLFISFCSAFLLPVPLFAHTGAGELHGFADGFSHPLTGWDHLLALAAVGLWAFQIGGRSRWVIPAAFFLSMTLGLWAGTAGMPSSGLEFVLVASVVLLGVCIAAALRPSFILGIAVVAVIAGAHGLAHGLEMPAQASAVPFMAGMVAASLLVQGLAQAVASLFQNATGAKVVRIAGATGALCGVVIPFFL